MKLALVHSPGSQVGACPYRLLDEAGHEIAWANDFLDAQHLRQLSPRSLRAYAYDSTSKPLVRPVRLEKV